MRASEAAEIIEERTGKEVAVCSLVGSRNYNLQTDGSDHDFTAFVVPTAEDMYERSEYFKEMKGDGWEINVYDLRRIPELLRRSNPAALEYAFSEDRVMCREMEDLLYGNRERIAGMNLPYLFNSAVGASIHKMNTLEKGTVSTQHLVEKYGYDTKQGTHAMRLLYMLQWYAEDGVFETALRYGGTATGRERREFLLSIRSGRFTLEEMKETIRSKKEEIEERFKQRYLDAEADTEMMDVVRTEVKNFILGRFCPQETSIGERMYKEKKGCGKI